MEKKFVIEKEDIEIYGDDGRAIIRAFCDKIGDKGSDKENLEYVMEEIKYILEYEL